MRNNACGTLLLTLAAILLSPLLIAAGLLALFVLLGLSPLFICLGIILEGMKG